VNTGRGATRTFTIEGRYIHHVALSFALATLGNERLAAQESRVQADLPGAYSAGTCARAPFPTELPPLESVFDTTKLAAELRSVGVSKRVVFGVRLGALATTPRVRVIERKVSEAVADSAVTVVDAALHESPSDRQWAFRLRVDGERELQMRSERSEVCGATLLPGSESREIRSEIRSVPATEVTQLRREATEYHFRRRSMVHRVLIDTQGRALAVELARSSGDAQMDADQTEYLKQRMFTPTRLDGVPVSAWVELRGDYGPRR